MRQALSTALVAVALVLAVAAPGHAQGMSARRMDDGHHDGGGHHEGGGQHDGRDHGHRGDHDRDGRHRFPFVGGPYLYWNPYPVYVTPTPGYWYYCPSAEAYYPYVTYCLDAWVPVPAQ